MKTRTLFWCLGPADSLFSFTFFQMIAKHLKLSYSTAYSSMVKHGGLGNMLYSISGIFNNVPTILDLIENINTF